MNFKPPPKSLPPPPPPPPNTAASGSLLRSFPSILLSFPLTRTASRAASSKCVSPYSPLYSSHHASSMLLSFLSHSFFLCFPSSSSYSFYRYFTLSGNSAKTLILNHMIKTSFFFLSIFIPLPLHPSVSLFFTFHHYLPHMKTSHC